MSDDTLCPALRDKTTLKAFLTDNKIAFIGISVGGPRLIRVFGPKSIKCSLPEKWVDCWVEFKEVDKFEAYDEVPVDGR